MPIINMVYKKKKGGVNPYDLLSDVIVYYEMKGNLNDRGPNQWNISTITGSYSGTDYNTFTNYRGVNTSASASTTQSITLSAWVNGSDGVILCIGSDSYSGWGLNITWKRIAAVINGSAYETTSLTSLSGWHLITGVFDYTGRTLKFYVDSTLQYTKNLPSSGGLRGGNYILMGGASNTAGVLTGKAGITFATQNAMTQADIQAFYDASKDLYQGSSQQTVQTFDFQNDGALSWTGLTIYGTPSYTSGQGWTIATNTSSQSAIMPPSSVYNGEKLVKYKLRMYKSTASTSSKTAGCGMSASSHSNGLVCCNFNKNGVTGANVYNGSSDTFTQTTDIVGEATLEYYLNDDGSLELSINGGTKYNLGNFATLFRTDWQNNNLGICIGAWLLNSAFYVRKVEITTEP